MTSGLESLTRIAGVWKGTYRLQDPAGGVQQSRSAASVTPVIGGKFVRLDYTWSYGGKAQEGSLLFGWEKKRRVVTTVWTDTWHMGEKFMTCQGAAAKNGAVAVRGSYAVSTGPDWGWRTVIEPGEGSFRLVMYNQWPDGKEELAVEATYTGAQNRNRKPR
jgi:hypothetical protein